MSDSPQHWRKAIITGVAALVPLDDGTADWLARRKAGAAVAMNPDHVRNAERSALFHVLCKIVSEHHDELKDKDAVKHALKILTGRIHVDRLKLADGSIMWLQRARSVAFHRMEEQDFESFFDAALLAIETELLPGCDIDALRKDAYLRAGVQK